MRPRLLLLVILIAAAVLPVSADLGTSFEHARIAQATLGPDTWSRVIRVENENKKSIYPESFHALVFEFAGVLWLYVDVNGTQSLSLHRNRLAQEKADLLPLLREIEPGFRRWRPADDGASSTDEIRALPNGCFIESIAEWQNLVKSGARVTEPKLLSFYSAAKAPVSGHTVLSYRVGDRVKVIDPGVGTYELPGAFGGDPLVLARAVAGNIVAKARFLPIPGSTGTAAGAWAATGNVFALGGAA